MYQSSFVHVLCVLQMKIVKVGGIIRKRTDECLIKNRNGSIVNIHVLIGCTKLFHLAFVCKTSCMGGLYYFSRTEWLLLVIII